jgi:hypothetical protein
MTTRLITKNKQTQPAAVIRVWHEGPNDYRVQIDGAGEYSKTTQLGYAVQNASWLAALSGADFGHEVLKVIESTINL